MTDATRAYTRVVLRLRAQAEKEVSKESRSASRARSRASSRAPSPTFSQSTHGGGHRAVTPVSHGFKSPLFRLRRAPLLRCFVPSPDGDWLSDASVLECEAELKRAGVIHLLRVGDVVWDIAVGDEGNVGRLVWDGSYLIVSSFLLGGYCEANGYRRIWIIHTRLLAIFPSICPQSRSRRRTSIGSSGLDRHQTTRLFASTWRLGEKRSQRISNFYRTEFGLRREWGFVSSPNTL